MNAATSATREPSAASPADHGTAPTVPPALCGLWRRVVLESPGAPADTTTRVFWLQTPTLYVDLRVPSSRSLGVPRCALSAMDDRQLAELAQQSGFAGQAFLEGDVCRWRRDVDFQPPTGVPDEGRLEIDGDVIVEDGVHAAYREVWQRVEDSTGDWLARRWTADDGTPGGRECFLVAGGTWFLYARARGGAPLPHATSLGALAQSRGLDRTALGALLDFEISLGRRAGDVAAWRIELSTLPAREGAALGPLALG